MKVSLFGGSGFVGNYIVDELIDNNCKPYVLLRHGSESKLSKYNDCRIITGDLDNPTAIEQTMMNTEAVIYNVGIIREFKSHGITFEKLHFEGLVKCVEQAKKLNIKRFILMSANGVKRNGTGYQTTKYYGEQELINSSLNWTIFRPSLIFGDSNGKDEFCEQLKNDMLSLPLPAPLFHKGLLPFNAGKFKMSPIHVKNVASFFVKSINMENAIHKTYKLGGPNEYTWKEIINIISQSYGKNKWTLPAPIIPIKFMAFFLERFKWFPVTRGQLTMLLEGNTCDSKKIFKEFNIEPIKFTKEALEYLKK